MVLELADKVDRIPLREIDVPVSASSPVEGASETARQGLIALGFQMRSGSSPGPRQQPDLAAEDYYERASNRCASKSTAIKFPPPKPKSKNPRNS